MGNAESSEGRRVSFGMDEERVRVLQGIRLSEDVVNRMKDSSQPLKAQQPAPPSSACGSQKESRPPRSEDSSGQEPLSQEDLLRRYEQEQAIIRDNLFQREREAAIKHLKVSLQKEESVTDQEKQKSTQLTAEMYKLSLQQFHEAASKMESTLQPRRVEPVCTGLQAQILRCYRENLQEVLLCSDLVKAYQRCVSAAREG
ncbi:MICOS complex subunit MIC25 isoform X2 [Dasypus novemcinctus]|uniref:MICOS complex subunit MIC25 isoform X2 n=1 Tax=Dasypus novemcinctus TaxID=9361 RepID=UPI0026600103|nr:MICOS complex subunit MIC25 isoform X2 [Dasypus novemcinctus]